MNPNRPFKNEFNNSRLQPILFLSITGFGFMTAVKHFLTDKSAVYHAQNKAFIVKTAVMLIWLIYP
jgi:hypothetical protein